MLLAQFTEIASNLSSYSDSFRLWSGPDVSSLVEPLLNLSLQADVVRVDPVNVKFSMDTLAR